MESEEIAKIGGKIIKIHGQVEKNASICYHTDPNNIIYLNLDSKNGIYRDGDFIMVSNNLPNDGSSFDPRSFITKARIIIYKGELVYNQSKQCPIYDFIFPGVWQEKLRELSNKLNNASDYNENIKNPNMLAMFDKYIRHIAPINETFTINVGDNIQINKTNSTLDTGYCYEVIYCGEVVLKIFQGIGIRSNQTHDNSSTTDFFEKYFRVTQYKEGIWENILVNYFDYCFSQNSKDNFKSKLFSELFTRLRVKD